MKSPLVFTFNISRRYFDSFGLFHFKNVQQSLRDRPVLLFPVVNDGFNTIEQRAEFYKDYFQVIVPKAMRKRKWR
jgi:hypothetical protein